VTDNITTIAASPDFVGLIGLDQAATARTFSLPLPDHRRSAAHDMCTVTWLHRFISTAMKCSDVHFDTHFDSLHAGLMSRCPEYVPELVSNLIGIERYANMTS